MFRHHPLLLMALSKSVLLQLGRLGFEGHLLHLSRG